MDSRVIVVLASILSAISGMMFTLYSYRYEYVDEYAYSEVRTVKMVIGEVMGSPKEKIVLQEIGNGNYILAFNFDRRSAVEIGCSFRKEGFPFLAVKDPEGNVIGAANYEWRTPMLYLVDHQGRSMWSIVGSAGGQR
ncbi:MAG: hypothetical protein AB1499_18390 [Nitrospirota bacterium]